MPHGEVKNIQKVDIFRNAKKIEIVQWYLDQNEIPQDSAICNILKTIEHWQQKTFRIRCEQIDGNVRWELTAKEKLTEGEKVEHNYTFEDDDQLLDQIADSAILGVIQKTRYRLTEGSLFKAAQECSVEHAKQVKYVDIDFIRQPNKNKWARIRVEVEYNTPEASAAFKKDAFAKRLLELLKISGVEEVEISENGGQKKLAKKGYNSVPEETRTPIAYRNHIQES